MKLNIETKNPEETLGIIREVYFNHEVTLDASYKETADYSIVSHDGPGRVFPMDGLMELAYCLGYAAKLWKIRIY